MSDKNWRNDDPDASKDWEPNARLMRLAYDIVCKFPGLTAREVGAKLETHTASYGHEILRRRLSDLKRDGYIIYGERKVCPYSGKSVGTWWPKPAAEARQEKLL